MPTVADLEQTIDTRYEQLQQLLDLTTLQESAIEQGHMNELMRVLGEKQRLIEQFVSLSQQFKQDYEAFESPPKVSPSHRERNQSGDAMHRELLEREASCQTKLEAGRNEIAQELRRGEGARRAAAGYGQSQTRAQTRGGGLDLSNDA